MIVEPTGHSRHARNAVAVFRNFTLGGKEAPPFLRTYVLQHLTRQAEFGGLYGFKLPEKAKKSLDNHRKNMSGKCYAERYVDSLLEMQNKVNGRGNRAVLTAEHIKAIKSEFIFDGDTIKVRPAKEFEEAMKPPDKPAEKTSFESVYGC